MSNRSQCPVARAIVALIATGGACLHRPSPMLEAEVSIPSATPAKPVSSSQAGPSPRRAAETPSAASGPFFCTNDYYKDEEYMSRRPATCLPTADACARAAKNNAAFARSHGTTYQPSDCVPRASASCYRWIFENVSYWQCLGDSETCARSSALGQRVHGVAAACKELSTAPLGPYFDSDGPVPISAN